MSFEMSPILSRLGEVQSLAISHAGKKSKCCGSSPGGVRAGLYLVSLIQFYRLLRHSES